MGDEDCLPYLGEIPSYQQNPWNNPVVDGIAIGPPHLLHSCNLICQSDIDGLDRVDTHGTATPQLDAFAVQSNRSKIFDQASACILDHITKAVSLNDNNAPSLPPPASTLRQRP